MRLTPRQLVGLVLLLPAMAHSLDISALSGVVIDAGSGKVLWAKDEHHPRFPASTTKVLTGLLLVEHTKPTDVIVAPPDIESVKDSSMHLKPGEKVTSRDLLYAIMLRSANDGAYAVAVHVSGSAAKFADLMNQRAAELGLHDSHFANPNGLPNPNHTTSAYDLAMIAREAMSYQEFKEVVRTQRHAISRSINFRDRMMVSRNKWLAKDPTADGIKTGWTVAAGHCYVGSAKRDGFRVIDSILKSDNWQADHQKMLQYAFETYEARSFMPQGVAACRRAIPNAAAKLVDLAPDRDAYSLVPRSDPRHETREILVAPDVKAPLRAGARVATLKITDPDGFVHSVPLVTVADVPAATGLANPTNRNLWTVLIGVGLLGGVQYLRGRARKAARRRARRISGN